MVFYTNRIMLSTKIDRNKLSNFSLGRFLVVSVLRLREFRENRKMSQRDVSKVMEIKQSSYWAWETGKASPSPLQIIKLCKLFECTPNDLFGVKGQYQTSMFILDEE